MSVDLLATGAIVSRASRPVFDHLGPRVEILTETDAPATVPGLLRGRIAPDQTIPMHSHSSPETFYVLDGALEGLTFDRFGNPRWTQVVAGEVFSVPPDARHALRNVGTEPATTLIITSHDLVDFFETTGRPVESFDDVLPPPTAEYLAALVAEATQRGHWLASPDENAGVGIQLPSPPRG